MKSNSGFSAICLCSRGDVDHPETVHVTQRDDLGTVVVQDGGKRRVLNAVGIDHLRIRAISPRFLGFWHPNPSRATARRAVNPLNDIVRQRALSVSVWKSGTSVGQASFRAASRSASVSRISSESGVSARAAEKKSARGPSLSARSQRHVPRCPTPMLLKGCRCRNWG